MFKGVAFDSRTVRPGFIFVAIKGLNFDGHDFIDEAFKNGASLVYGEKDIKNPKYIRVTDSRQKLGELASEFYQNPSQRLTVIGVTGTKGKTTTCHLIWHLLNKLGKKAGLISSNTMGGYHITSPDSVTLQSLLKKMVDEGKKYAVVEVSSHAIDQKRIAGVKFDVAVLTNIAPEHLDYHKTFTEYKKIKFSFLKMAKIAIMAPQNTNLSILPGKFNNLNAETALKVIKALKLNQKKALEALCSFKLPEGRLESLKNKRGIRIIVDFAHTPDSLRAVLTYLKETGEGKLISVFGCAGERDSKKRSEMGKVSSEIADFSVFTAEDPRSENIFDILNKMEKNARNYVTIPERGEAIAYALGLARPQDTVAVLGKGHEKSLAYKGFEHPWSDREFIFDLLKADKSVGVIVLAAGKGRRMRSRLPKVLHEICGRPMISYTLENLRKAGVGEIVVVVGFRKKEVEKRITGMVKIAVQNNPAGGTADAAKAGFKLISQKVKTLIVINGDDSAFYKPETIKNILRIHTTQARKLTFVSLIKDDPTGLGRVIRGKDGLIAKIVEEKDATNEERKIKEVNDGLYVFDRKWFGDNVGRVKRSQQGEYYLVDLVKMAIDQKEKVATFTLPNDDEWQGINTPEQLVEANKKMEARLK